MGIEIFPQHWTLEHLWIVPEKIRHGLGTQAISYLLKEAKSKNIQSIYLLPDPPAEVFYLKLGILTLLDEEVRKPIFFGHTRKKVLSFIVPYYPKSGLE